MVLNSVIAIIIVDYGALLSYLCGNPWRGDLVGHVDSDLLAVRPGDSDWLQPQLREVATACRGGTSWR